MYDINLEYLSESYTRRKDMSGYVSPVPLPVISFVANPDHQTTVWYMIQPALIFFDQSVLLAGVVSQLPDPNMSWSSNDKMQLVLRVESR